MQLELKPEKIGYAVVMQGPTLGHIKPDGGVWRWTLNAPVNAEGTARDADEAREQLKSRYFLEMQKLFR